MHPGEGLVGDGVPAGLVRGDRGGLDGVPDRRLARAEDRRRAHQHPRRTLQPPQRRVDVALDHRVVVGVVGHQGAVLGDVADTRAAVVDGRGRDVDDQRHPRRTAASAMTSVPSSPTRRWLLAVTAQRVHRRHQRVGAGDHGGREHRVAEVADVLLDARQRRGGTPPVVRRRAPSRPSRSARPRRGCPRGRWLRSRRRWEKSWLHLSGGLTTAPTARRTQTTADRSPAPARRRPRPAYSPPGPAGVTVTAVTRRDRQSHRARGRSCDFRGNRPGRAPRSGL